MFDLFGRKRIAELEKDLIKANKETDSWKEFSRLCIYEGGELRGRLRDIHAETYLGKSGTAQKIARMAWKALEVHGDD